MQIHSYILRKKQSSQEDKLTLIGKFMHTLKGILFLRHLPLANKLKQDIREKYYKKKGKKN